MEDVKIEALRTTATKLKHSGQAEEAAELSKPLVRKRDNRGVYQSVNFDEIPASIGHLLQIEEQEVGLLSDSQESGYPCWRMPQDSAQKKIRTFEKISMFREQKLKREFERLEQTIAEAEAKLLVDRT